MKRQLPIRSKTCLMKSKKGVSYSQNFACQSTTLSARDRFVEFTFPNGCRTTRSNIALRVIVLLHMKCFVKWFVTDWINGRTLNVRVIGEQVSRRGNDWKCSTVFRTEYIVCFGKIKSTTLLSFLLDRLRSGLRNHSRTHAINIMYSRPLSNAHSLVRNERIARVNVLSSHRWRLLRTMNNPNRIF